MIERPWCGPVFTAGGAAYGIAAGRFARRLVFADHARSADILFSFRSDSLDPFGLMGRTWSADGAVGFGVHGGWHANEMSSVRILAGPLIEKRLRLASSLRHLRHCADSARSSGPFATGNMTGRALAEIFIDDGQDVPRTVEKIYETSSGRRGLRRRAEFEARLRGGTLKSGRLRGKIWVAGGRRRRRRRQQGLHSSEHLGGGRDAREVAGERHLSELSSFMVQQAPCPRRVGSED